jgi:hypothetical protein
MPVRGEGKLTPGRVQLVTAMCKLPSILDAMLRNEWVRRAGRPAPSCRRPGGAHCRSLTAPKSAIHVVNNGLKTKRRAFDDRVG